MGELPGRIARLEGKVHRSMSEVHPPVVGATTPLRFPDGDDLAAIMASRICHDLVSPLGAIANGIELLLLSGTERSPEMDLISESVESANARMRFFRLAFGAASAQSIGRAEITSTLQGIQKGSRLSFDWTPPGDHPRGEVKAVFLLLQCLESAMPLGGQIRVTRDGSAWELAARGPRIRIDQQAWDAIGPGRTVPPDKAALVQFALLPAVVDALGRRLEVEFGPESITVRF